MLRWHIPNIRLRFLSAIIYNVLFLKIASLPLYCSDSYSVFFPLSVSEDEQSSENYFGPVLSDRSFTLYQVLRWSGIS